MSVLPTTPRAIRPPKQEWDEMDDEQNREYDASLGTMMDARKQYDDAIKAHGAESWPAEQAHDYLQRATVYRNEMRERYDAARDSHVEE
ncbi:MAG: hypothetical protein PVSMB7_22400 [Chloroflexota bacterium]